jgi:hypothetical protein
MKITIKAGGGDSFEVHANPDDTVASLRQQIQAERSAGDHQVLKLVFAGTLLNDDRTLQSYSIREAPKIRKRTEGDGAMVHEGTSYPVIHIAPQGGSECCAVS